MTAKATVSGILSQPQTVGDFLYRAAVETRPDPKAVLWDNVSALMRHHYGGENLTRLATDCGIGPGTASRIKSRETSVGLDVIEKICARFDLAVWQVFVPGLEPGNPPVLREASPAERRLYQQFLEVKRTLESIRDEGPPPAIGHVTPPK